MRSLDHFVGLREQARRDSDADRPRRRQVDDQLELGWLHDWHVCWFLALENAAGIDADLVIAPEVARSITHEPTDFGKFAQKVDSWQQITRRKRHDLHATINKKWVGTDEKRVRPIPHKSSKGYFDLAASFGFVHVDVPPDRFCRHLRVLSDSLCGNWICGIDKECDPRGARHQLVR